MDLSFITRPRGVEIPDPVDTYKQRVSLAEIGRAGQLHQIKLDEVRRAQEEQDALRNVLGDLPDAGGLARCEAECSTARVRSGGARGS
jgi:hypothetical protein